MTRVTKSGNSSMETSGATRKKARRGSRSVASIEKRQARRAQQQNEAGPSREVLIANRDAEMPEADEDEDEVLIDPSSGTMSLPAAIILDDEGEASVAQIDPESTSGEAADGEDGVFAPLSNEASTGKLASEMRRIPIPPHRMAPLKKEWVNIFTPLTEMLGLQVRMNVTRKAVEMRTSKYTKDMGAIQKGADFFRAFAYGFLIADAIALLRLDDLYLDSFEIKDVKSLSGDHLSRAIGRIAGQDGKTRFTIENATRTRVILADTKVHILGSFQNIKLAKDAIVALILGSPPGKVYASLRTIGARLKQRAI